MFGFRGGRKAETHRAGDVSPASAASSAWPLPDDEHALRLLSAFLVPCSASDWPDASNRATCQRWIADGRLRPATVIAVVTASWPLTQLRALLHERGLTASGTKGAMAVRLLDADAAIGTSILRTPRYVYAGDGHALRRRVPQAHRPQPPKPVRTAWQHLQERNIAGAVRAVAAYHAAGIFPPERAARWAHPRHWRDMAQLLAMLFSTWPRLVEDVPYAARGTYRVAAGMMALLDAAHADEWIDPATPGHPRLANDVVAKMVLHAVRHTLSRRRWRSDDVTDVRLTIPADACAACRALDGCRLPLRLLPDLPLADCRCALGFRGEVVPDSPSPPERVRERAWRSMR